MNIKDSCKLTELYAACPECGCDLIGNGKGTLECDTEVGFFKRTCACGWSVTMREQSPRIKNFSRCLEASAPDQLDLNRENLGQSLLIRQLETELHDVKSERDAVISDLRAQQEQEKNEPLTLKELLEMDGEPVWCVFDPDADGEQLTMWALVEVDFESDGDVYLTNNLGGRSGYRTDRGFAEDGITIYRRKPAGGDGQ